jgi:hypothetical protein
MLMVASQRVIVAVLMEFCLMMLKIFNEGNRWSKDLMFPSPKSKIKMTATSNTAHTYELEQDLHKAGQVTFLS